MLHAGAADLAGYAPPDGTRTPMSRLRSLPPDELDDDQRALHGRIAGGPRAAGPQRFRLTNDDGSLTGPFNVFLHAPTTGAAFSAVGEAIRYGTGLSARIRELAILAVASHRDSVFERYAHERVGRSIGLTEEEIAAVRELGPLELSDPAEAVAYRFCRRALLERRVDDDLYAEAVTELGEQQVVELTALLGYYDALSLLLSVFEVGAPLDPSPPSSVDG
jgi:4-carboxymuconolactone decarboxylase